MPPAPRATPSTPARRATLQIVLAAGVVEAVLVVLLLLAVVALRGAVSLVGPIAALAFAYVLYLAATGAIRGMWGWWFPGVVLVTAGLAAIPLARRMRDED
jgi:hypothetical protein